MDQPLPSPRALGRLSRNLQRVAVWLLLSLLVYLVTAYLVTPGVWSHFTHQPGLASKPMVTLTAQGIAGDPINVGLVGSEREIITAMDHAGWQPADAITLFSSFAIGKSVILNQAYPTAPISSLFYDGKHQVLAFEKADGISARRRHHVRFWPTLRVGAEGRPVWLGAASFDRGVGVSRYTGQITHHIGPDLDAERGLLIEDLTRAQVLATIYQVSGIGPTATGRNGGGDPYFTDGEVAIGVVTPAAKQGAVAETLPDSPAVETKNSLWASLVGFARRVHLVADKAQASDAPFDAGFWP